VFLVSALKGEGVADVRAGWRRGCRRALALSRRPGRRHSLALLAAEVTREKIYLRLHDELPYASAVETEKWEERRDGSVKIDQVIYVQREGQKAIVLGKGGATIKIIGGLAREELEKLFGRRVHLFLFREGARGLGRE
jgi:GTP-binding protein Era